MDILSALTLCALAVFVVYVIVRAKRNDKLSTMSVTQLQNKIYEHHTIGNVSNEYTKEWDRRGLDKGLDIRGMLSSQGAYDD